MAKLKSLKKELDLKSAYGLAYGLVDNYLVTFTQIKNEITIFVDAKVDPEDQTVVEKMRHFIQSSASSYKIVESSLSNTGISLTVSDTDQDLVIELFYLLINQLRLFRIPGADCCSNCGMPISDRRIVKIGSHVHACDYECSMRILSSDRAKSVQKPATSQAVSGFIGALIFSVLGAIPYILLGYNGIPCFFAAVIIPIAAGLGFTLFNGKKGIAKLIFCFILPLAAFASACIGLLANSVYVAWWDNGYVFTVNEVISAVFASIKTSEYIKAEFVMRQLLFGGIFLAIGYIFTLPNAYARPVPYITVIKDNRNA